MKYNLKTFILQHVTSISNRFLYMSFMWMIPPVFSGIRDKGQHFCREKPLPDQFPCSVFIFLFQHSNHYIPVPNWRSLVPNCHFCLILSCYWI